MIRVKELRDRIIHELKGLNSERENINLSDIIIRFYTGIDKYKIITDPDTVIDSKVERIILEKLAELKRLKPVQYITGQAFFNDLEIEVSPAVLIPRPETEELVKWITDDYASVKGLRILDMGTGSGCIIIALGKYLEHSELTAVDISEEAIIIARRNAERYRVPVVFQRFDILNEREWERSGAFDVIVSNPPYVRFSEKVMMKSNVLEYEPDSALFVPDHDPLVFYSAISRFAGMHLEPGGRLYFEINENFGREVVTLLEDHGFVEVILRKDMQGKDRFVCAILNGQPQIYKQ